MKKKEKTGTLKLSKQGREFKKTLGKLMLCLKNIEPQKIPTVVNMPKELIDDLASRNIFVSFPKK